MTAARWRRARAEHRNALDRYLALIESLDDARWSRSRAPGQWSPALITQHLILYYEGFERVVAGELEMRYRVGPLWRTGLRWILLPHILFHRSFPVKAVAPREVRPSGDPLPRAESIERLRAAFERAEGRVEGLEGRRGVRVSHPYFGRIPLLRFLRLSAVHLDHHRRQVEATPVG